MTDDDPSQEDFSHSPLTTHHSLLTISPSALNRYRAIVSDEARGVVPAIVRFLLLLAAFPYALAMRVRNWRYDSNPRRIVKVGVPVVSVGNITLGGTGKTPVVEWIARWFREHDVRVTIVSRGYGADEGARNDEALELEERLPDVPHLQNPDRVEAARLAIEEFECQLVLLDDGFQHRRIGRDLDIVLLDATQSFDANYVFPRGILREPLVGLRRARVVILSRADLVGEPLLGWIRLAIKHWAPTAVWAEARHAPRELRDARGEAEPIESLRGERVAAFCGIGNPDGFRRTLESCGAKVVKLREYPDHHAYSRADVDDLQAWAARQQADRIVCTHKDLVKVRVDRLGGKLLSALVVGIEFLAGQEAIEAELERVRRLVEARDDGQID